MKTLLLILFFKIVVIANINFINHNNELLNNSKTIYVDVSLNNVLKNNKNNLSLRFYENSELVEISLISQENDICFTKDKISFNELTNKKTSFVIYCKNNSYASEPIFFSSFKDYDYNYVCINNDANVVGYGCYCNKKENPEATYETQRIWLNNNNKFFYQEDEWGTPCCNVVSYHSNSSLELIRMVPFTNAFDGNIYYYADIPFNVSCVHFLRMSNNEDHDFVIYQDVPIDLTYGVCYFAGTSNYNDFLTIRPGIVQEADSSLLAKVLETYLTYGKEQSNGSDQTTIKHLFTTWFEHKSASDLDLKKITILDYTGYKANNYSYKDLTKNEHFSIYEKWRALCDEAKINYKTGEEKTNYHLNFYIIIIILVISFIFFFFVAFFAFKYFKGRKSNS